MGLDITARDITQEQIHPLMSEKLCNGDQVSEQLLHQTHTHKQTQHRNKNSRKIKNALVICTKEAHSSGRKIGKFDPEGFMLKCQPISFI